MTLIQILLLNGIVGKTETIQMFLLHLVPVPVIITAQELEAIKRMMMIRTIFFTRTSYHASPVCSILNAGTPLASKETTLTVGL